FQPARTSATDIHPASLTVGDVDQDGKLDLAINDAWDFSGDAIGILLGQGDGTFAPPVFSHLGVEYGPSVVTSLATGDLNADGKMDVVASWRDVYGYLGTFFNVLLGHGDGTFDQVAKYGPYFLGNSFNSLTLADFDGDSNLDLADPYSGIIQLGNGDGTFQDARYPGIGGYSLTAADFDADGKLDLAMPGYASLRV